jgi:hypothetical protein
MRFPSALDPIRSLTASWKLITRAPGPLIVGGLLLTLTDGGMNGGGQFNGGGRNSDFDWDDVLRIAPFVVGCVCFLWLAVFLISSWLWIGFPRAVDEARATGTTSFTTVFDSRGRYFDMLLARLLALVLGVAAIVPYLLIAGVCYLLYREQLAHETAVIVAGIAAALVYTPVYVYCVLGLSWVPQVVAIEERAPLDAVKRSWQLASGCRVSLAVFWLVLAIFTMIGVCACCIGVLFTGAWSYVSRCEAFLELTREDARPIAPPRVSYESGPVEPTSPAVPPASPYGAPFNPPPEPPSWPPPPAS